MIDDFERDGVMVIRGVVPADDIRSWQRLWGELYNPERTPEWNPVALNESRLLPLLALIARHPVLLNIVEEVFGADIALYNQRFVVKDKHSRGPVFLHHDTPYHFGFPRKASMFVPLSEVTQENGGMTFYLGTHRFGYLGDAGELNESALPQTVKAFTPSLAPGDLLLMHSATWHASGPHIVGPDRVMADIIYQPANDPSGIELLRGQWLCERFDYPYRQLFKKSRSDRLKEMQKEIKRLSNDERTVK